MGLSLAIAVFLAILVQSAHQWAKANMGPSMDGEKSQPRLTRSKIVTLSAMVFERLLPRALPAIAVAALFFIALWFGLFRLVPSIYHYGVLALFGLLFLGALTQLRHFRWPSKQSITARLEAHNALEHAPLQTQTDAIATSGSPLERTLWLEHQKRMAAKISTLEGGRPDAKIAPKKRYVAFASLAGITAIAFAFSNAPQGGAWADILSKPPALAATQPRFDLWLTPPNYTGKAPVFVKASAETGVISVPRGSLATLRVSRAENTPPEALDAVAFSFSKGNEPPTLIEKAKAGLYEWTMTDSGILNVKAGKATLRSIAVNVIQDQAPSISWKDAITVNRNGSFELKYQSEDDYGIRGGWGSLAFQDPVGSANPLYEMPEIMLRMRAAKGLQNGQSRIALGDHPLAGIPMTLTLHVKDAAEQEGQSEARNFTLPQRTFSNPVALALVEQRGLIARDSQKATHVLRLMEAMMLHPEIVINDAGGFLGIRTAYQRIRAARSDDDLRDVVDYLWAVALDIEEGQLSDAEKRLKEAREKLREAIEEGADEQELSQRIQELRDALNNYLQELARQMDRNGQNQQQAQNQQNQQQIEAQDLQDMLDKIEELAQQGAKEQAEELLSQMEQMLDNLQAGQHQQEQGDNQQSQMQQRMNELGEIMREQQELMDQTFQQQQPQQGQGQEQGENSQQGQGQQDPNQPGQNQQGQNQQGQNGEGQPNQPSNQGQAMQRLQQSQQNLQQRLRDFTQSLEGMGIDPGNEFGEAQGSMGDAGDSLGQGDAESATGQQADALQALRDGASDMMQQMQEAMEGERGGQNPQQAQQSERQGGNDPLGRPQQSNSPQFDSDVYVPDEIDMQRAREILNAIRKRLGDEAAPNSEKDYLERLLEFD